jgi:hypothetical protein
MVVRRLRPYYIISTLATGAAAPRLLKSCRLRCRPLAQSHGAMTETGASLRGSAAGSAATARLRGALHVQSVSAARSASLLELFAAPHRATLHCSLLP